MFQLPEPQMIVDFQEPFVRATIITPDDFIGSIMSLLLVSIKQILLTPDDSIRSIMFLLLVSIKQVLLTPDDY